MQIDGFNLMIYSGKFWDLVMSQEAVEYKYRYNNRF